MAETTVSEALRRALLERGFDVQYDTVGSGSKFYLMGENDLARALFEIHSTAHEAVDVMYQGAWVAGLPPRFAVLPDRAAQEDAFELLEQMRIIPLLYPAEEPITFPTLDELLDANL